MCQYKVVFSLNSLRQPPNFTLNPRTKSNPKTVLGLGLQPQNFLVFGGLQHAPPIIAPEILKLKMVQ